VSAHAEDVRSRRRKAAGPAKAVPLSRIGLAPEQVAFIGEAAEENVFVQILCWPTMPTAWSALAEAAASMRAIRDGLSMSNPVTGSSWLQQVAPQLSGPLEREWGAAESTLATLIRRLPVRFAVAIVRLAWRVTHGEPEPDAGMPPWQTTSERIVHWLLYALLFVLPVLGWINASWRGMPIVMFGLELPQLVATRAAGWDWTGDVHALLANYLLLTLVGLHVLAALYHYFIRRDGVLQRMLPGA